MAAGGKKDAEYLAGVTEEEIFKFYPKRMHTNVFYFDGAANVQKSGLRLYSFYSRSDVFHGGIAQGIKKYGGENFISPIKVHMCAFIFFVYLSKILFYCFTLNLLQILILEVCRMYNVSGSGAAHGIYAKFIQKSGVYNNGKRIGLLRGSGTRFATYFYPMIRLVHIQAPMLATIHQAIFYDIILNDRV